MDITIIGMEATFAALDKHMEDVQAAANEAVQAAGIECQAEAKKACPVDTGRLRSSILYHQGEQECTVDTNVEYASYVEHGTKNQRAQPFLFPAFELARQHLVEELANL